MQRRVLLVGSGRLALAKRLLAGAMLAACGSQVSGGPGDNFLMPYQEEGDSANEDAAEAPDDGNSDAAPSSGDATQPGPSPSNGGSTEAPAAPSLNSPSPPAGQSNGTSNPGTGTIPGDSVTAPPPTGDQTTGGTDTVVTPPPLPAGNLLLLETFEAGAAGSQPSGWDRWINYSNQAGNTLGSQQFALLDASEAHSGSQSIHFHAEGATQPAMLTRALPTGLNRLFVRMWTKTRIQVGGVEADRVSNHETLLALRTTTNDGNNELRFGGAKGALGFNIVGSGGNDAVAPQQALWGSGPGLTPSTWHCVEIGFDNTNPNAPVATAWLDDNEVRRVTDDWHIGILDGWLSGRFVEVVLGWQSFSPAPANDVWMDDIALSTERVGCSP